MLICAKEIVNITEKAVQTPAKEATFLGKNPTQFLAGRCLRPTWRSTVHKASQEFEIPRSVGKKTTPERPGAVSKPGLTTCSLHLPMMQQHLCITHRPLQSSAGVQPICPSLMFVCEEPAIITYQNHQKHHSGVSHTLPQLRNEHWIPQGRAEVKKAIHRCGVCK